MEKCLPSAHDSGECGGERFQVRHGDKDLPVAEDIWSIAQFEVLNQCETWVVRSDLLEERRVVGASQRDGAIQVGSADLVVLATCHRKVEDVGSIREKSQYIVEDFNRKLDDLSSFGGLW